MVTFPYILIPNAAVEQKWDADSMCSLEILGRRKTSYRVSQTKLLHLRLISFKNSTALANLQEVQ